jgi:hypothetical protein
MKNAPRSRLKGCVEAIGVIAGFLTIITSFIVIYQFVSGNASLTFLFPAASATRVQATSTSVMNPSPTVGRSPLASLTSTPTASPPAQSTSSTPEDALLSSAPIPYDSFLTWFWWAVAGAFGGLVTGLWWELREFDGIANLDLATPFWGALIGLLSGVLFGFLSSLLINFWHIPYSLPTSMSIACVLSILSSLLIDSFDRSPKSSQPSE